jgi:hypothetical protein
MVGWYRIQEGNEVTPLDPDPDRLANQVPYMATWLLVGKVPGILGISPCTLFRATATILFLYEERKLSNLAD